MAQNIELMGAQYSAVPAVVLPKTGGGTARFTDTSGVTATAADVASGKIFVDASGEEQTGTASGGRSAEIEPLTVTENGTYTAPDGVDGYSPVTVNVAGGGGEWWDTPDPVDGKTHIWIEIPEDALRTDFEVRYTQSVSQGVTVDWGDGTDPQTYSGTTDTNHTHTYAQGGHYEITLQVTRGTIKFVGSSSNTLVGASTNPNYWRKSCVRRIFFGNGMTSGSIGSNVLDGFCAIKTVKIPSGVTSVGSYAFYGCKGLREVTIPPGVTSFGTYAFSNCDSLQQITIPSGVTTIGNYALQSCLALQKITIPSTVTSIGSSAFTTCRSVKEYHFEPTAPPTLGGTSAFSNIPSDCKFYVPYSEDHSILDAYKAATNWSTYASRMVEEDPE